MVDAAANLKQWVLLKGIGSMTTTTKMTLKLPSAAKSGIMDGLAQALDKLTALATMVGDAEVDDAATVPSELGTALADIGTLISGLATQFGAPAPADGGDGNAPPPPEGAPPPPEAAKSNEPSTGEVGKKLPTELHDGDSFKALMTDGDSLKTVLHKAIALAHAEIAAASISKAGRKMAGARYQKLSELHDSLGKLLNELAYDEANEKASNAAPAAKKNLEGGDGAAEITKAIEAANKVKADLKAEMSALEKRLTPTKSPVATSNGGTVEGGEGSNTAPVTKGKPVVWPIDHAKHIVEKRAKKATA
jgi:hypothetical protein